MPQFVMFLNEGPELNPPLLASLPLQPDQMLKEDVDTTAEGGADVVFQENRPTEIVLMVLNHGASIVMISMQRLHQLSFFCPTLWDYTTWLEMFGSGVGITIRLNII